MRGPLALVACLGAACALATDAGAQHPPLGGPEPRPLHVQLESADAVAIATVAAVGLGRIQLVDGVPVAGEVSATFELKRAPSAPPPLAEGDRVVLLLRGARTPYLLVSQPVELIQLGDPSETSAWGSRLRDLRDARSDGASLARTYAGWLDRAPDRMQRESAIGLAHRDCPESALRPEVVERLAQRATLASDQELRRFAARAAVRTPEGRRALLARVPGDDPDVLATALQAAATSDPDALAEPLLRALRHESAAIRGAALQRSGALSGDRQIRAQIVRIASEDPEERLRELARRVMKSQTQR